MYKYNKRRMNQIIMAASAIFIIGFILMIGMPFKAKAAASISISQINYVDSTITLKVNEGDSTVYFSDSQKKNWQEVPGDISSNNTITMDISWVNVSKNYIMTFKADKSTEVISVTLPKQITNFKANYNKIKGTITFNNAGNRTIEWRKKDSTTWNTVNIDTLTKELSYLYTNGATLYFRLAPVNGTASSEVGYRPSKEVAVVIPKKADAPSITINGSKFCIAVKKGMAYRVVNSDGTATEWTNITSSTDLFLKNIAAKALYTNATTAQSEVTLQFRVNATNSAQVSKIATVTVPVQEGPPNEDTNGISISYTSSSTVALQVKAANGTVPFEYTVVNKGEVLNYQTANWKTISSSAAISLSNTAAPTGSHIFVRKKSVNATGDDDFALASVEVEVTGAAGIEYPPAPTVTTLTTLISTAGVCRTDNSSGYLTFQLYSANSTTVSAINFMDAYGISKGTVTCKSTVAKNTGSTGTDDKYIITTKITSTSNLDTITEQLLYAKITLANSDVITSTDKTGIRLYLYPCSVINNPSEEEDVNHEYTDNFYRLFMSNDINDDSSFKFKIDLGTSYIPSPSEIGSYTSQAVEISSIKYDGYTLIKNSDYTVEYGNYTNDEDKAVATATVTIKVANFEKSSLIDITDVAEALHITLNNGEILNDQVGITLVSTAKLNNTPIAWTITEGKLKETKTTTTTDSNGNVSTVTEDLVNYTLTLTLFDKAYSVGIADVTWGGVSILGSTTISNGTATIYLSNAKLNKLTTNSTDTKNIVITLSNGFTITSGCKLTVLDSSQ